MSILISTLLLSMSAAQENPLESFLRLLKGPRKLVVWDNERYEHEIHDENLLKLSRSIGKMIHEDPKSLLRFYSELSNDQKARLRMDDPDRFRDPFDVLASEYRKTLSSELLTKHPSILISRSDFSSMAKTRLRKLFDNKSAPLFLVFRDRSSDVKGLSVCVDDQLRAEPFEISTKQKRSFNCGSERYYLQTEAVAASTPTSTRGPHYFSWPRAQDLTVVLTLGHQSEPRKSQMTTTSLLLEYWRAFQLVEQKEVDLSESLPPLLNSSQVILLASPWTQNGDAIRFFRDRSRAQQLTFKRTYRADGMNKKNLILHVLMPIDSKSSISKSDFKWTIQDWREFAAKKDTPTLLVELNDFSVLHMGRWLEVERAAKQEFRIITSNRALRAQRLVDILPLTDLFISVISELARGKNLDAITEHLGRGPQLMGTLANAYRALNNLDMVDYDFAPVTSWQREIQDFKASSNKSLWRLSGPSGIREIPPEPRIETLKN